VRFWTDRLRTQFCWPQTDPQSFKLGNRGDEAAADHRAITDAAGAATVAHRQRLMELERSGADVLGDLHHSLADLVNGVIEINLRASREMLRLTNYNEFVELQRCFFREYTTVLLCGSAQLVETFSRSHINTSSCIYWRHWCSSFSAASCRQSPILPANQVSGKQLVWLFQRLRRPTLASLATSTLIE
jgi:hypothetical protein